MIRLIQGLANNVQITKINSLIDSKRTLATFHGEVRYVHHNWAEVLAKYNLTQGNDWSDLSPGISVSASVITNCFKVDLEDGRSFFFKRYTYPKENQKRYWMRASKAQVEVFGYAQLAKVGISTLKVLAFGEKRSFGRLQAAYIVTEGINESIDLQQFAREVWFDLPRQQRSKVYLQLKDQIFDQLRCAHEVNFFHQDLHWRNILVTQKDGHYQTTWIDCPRAAYRKLPINAKHGQMVDLSCLARRSLDYLSRSERYRALDDYLNLNNKGWTTNALFKEIQAHHVRSPNPPKLLGIDGKQKQFNPHHQV